MNRKSFYQIIILNIILTISLLSCKKIENNPSISEIRNISELAVLDCYYHTVARTFVPSNGIGKSDKTIWDEFSVELKLGVDTSKMNMEIIDSTVYITLPPIEMIGVPAIIPESINHITSADGFLKNNLPPEKAIELQQEAQNSIVANLYKEDPSIIKNAEIRVKQIIESYIMRMGELSGKEYTIIWKTVDANAANETMTTSDNSDNNTTSKPDVSEQEK